MMNVKQTAKHAMRALGVYRRRLEKNPYDGVAVLAYHGVKDDRWPRGSVRFDNLHVAASRLASHFECLRELGCSVLSLTDWEQIARGTRPLPPRSVLVTFDDGYRNVLTCGVPVLERYEIPAAVFVCSRPVKRQVRFWFDAVASRSGEDAVERAKALDYETWRELADGSEMVARPDDPHAPLAVSELQQLAAHPLITIGAHTASHPILARAPIAVQREEIVESRAELEGWLGRAVTAFAYPNGRPGADYTDDTVALVAAAGFASAFTTGGAFAECGGAPFEHPRFLMLDSVDGPELAHRLATSWPRQQGAQCRAV